MNQTPRPFTFDRVVRIVGGIILAAVAIWLIDTLRYILLPFCVACLIAYMLEPIVDYNRRLLGTKGRVVACFITLFEVGLILGTAAFFFVPSVIHEVEHLQDLLHHEYRGSLPFIPENITDMLRQWMRGLDLESVLSSSPLRQLLMSSTSILSETIDFVMHTLEWLLTFIYVVLIMVDYKELMKGFRRLVPVKYRRTVYRLSDDVKDSMNRYFRSQALIALCAAILYSIGFSIVGIPLAIVLGLLVGILYMIPYVQYVTLLPVLAVCIIDSLGGTASFWPQFGSCILVYVVCQSICDYVLTPKIMGKAMGLNPAIILLSLSIWGTLLGILGMIIALPMTTLLLAYYNKYIVGEPTPQD